MSNIIVKTPELNTDKRFTYKIYITPSMQSRQIYVIKNHNMFYFSKIFLHNESDTLSNYIETDDTIFYFYIHFFPAIFGIHTGDASIKERAANHQALYPLKKICINTQKVGTSIGWVWLKKVTLTIHESDQKYMCHKKSSEIVS